MITRVNTYRNCGFRELTRPCWYATLGEWPMAKVGSAIPKQGSCPRQRGGDLPSEAWAAGSVLPIRCSLSRIGGGESSRPRLGIIPALAVEVTHSMAALRDSLNTSAACTLPEVPLHWRYTWDAYHVGLAGQRAAVAQGAAGFSPRGTFRGYSPRFFTAPTARTEVRGSSEVSERFHPSSRPRTLLA